MRKIKQNALKGLIIVDNLNVLIGTVTDGDIRKFLIKKNDLNEKVINICNRKPKYLYQNNLRTYLHYK